MIERLSEYFKAQTLEEKEIKRSTSEETITEGKEVIVEKEQSSDKVEPDVEPVKETEIDSTLSQETSKEDIIESNNETELVKVPSDNEGEISEPISKEKQEKEELTKEPLEKSEIEKQTSIPKPKFEKRQLGTDHYSVKKPKLDLLSVKKKVKGTPGRNTLVPKVPQPPCPLPKGNPQKEFTFCPPQEAPKLPKKFNLEESLKRPLNYTPHTGNEF